MMRPAISLLEVRALNCLQNSMMLICAWPSAGPTGGAGVALPASICNLTDVCTFFGAICDLPESFFFQGDSAVHALNRHPEAVAFPPKDLLSSVWHRHSACARKSLRCHFLYLPE